MGLTNYAPVLAAVQKPLIVFLLILLALVCFILVIFLFKYGYLYIRAAVSGAHVNFLTLIAMRLRRVDPAAIVQARIGAVKAEAIVAYREQNGPFRNTQELTEVDGIGSGTLEQIKHLITIED